MFIEAFVIAPCKYCLNLSLEISLNRDAMSVTERTGKPVCGLSSENTWPRLFWRSVLRLAKCVCSLAYSVLDKGDGGSTCDLLCAMSLRRCIISSSMFSHELRQLCLGCSRNWGGVLPLGEQSCPWSCILQGLFLVVFLFAMAQSENFAFAFLRML